jgi:hypothetical protein
LQEPRLKALAEKFDLPPSEVQELVAAAEQTVRHSTQFYPFTQQICQRIYPEARAHIIEMMWEVAYADGVPLRGHAAAPHRRADRRLHPGADGRPQAGAGEAGGGEGDGWWGELSIERSRP